MIPIVKIGTSIFALKDIKEATRTIEALSKAVAVEEDYNEAAREYEYTPEQCDYRGKVELKFVHPRQLKLSTNLTPKERRLTAGGSQ